MEFVLFNFKKKTSVFNVSKTKNNYFFFFIDLFI